MWVMNNNQFIKYQNFDLKNKAINNASIYSVDSGGNIKNYISSIAIETTINILKNNLTVDKKTDLINESIKELNTTLKV